MYFLSRLMMVGAAAFVAISALVLAFTILAFGAALLSLVLDVFQALAAWMLS